jgi:cation:H+ antiporter
VDTLTVVLFIPGLALLVVGAELLVRGASRLAAVMGISPLVIGLTVVAYGTSSPEMAVSMLAAVAGQADITLGNVVGSNIFNVLLILGLSAMIAPLVVSRQLVRLEVPLMIGISVLLFILALDGHLTRVDGLILFSGAISYAVFAIRQSRKENRINHEKATLAGVGTQPIHGRSIPVQIGLIIVGLGFLVLGSHWLVNGAVAFAQFFGVSELIIGLTIIAAGTSLPEVATSIIASIRGERDIAVGNVVGSNIFNILFVLGLSSLVSPHGITVAPPALSFDIPVMIAVALACLPVFFTGSIISRWEGALFFAYYIAYTLYLILDTTQHDALPLLNWVMAAFVLPLTVVTLVVVVFQQVRADNGHSR